MVYESRSSALSACESVGYDRLCTKAEIRDFEVCAEGWLSDWQGWWMRTSFEGCGGPGYHHLGLASAGAYCCKHGYVKRDRFVMLQVGASGCTSDGYEDIASEAECQSVIGELGLTALPKWTGSYSSIPRFCSVNPSSQGDQSRMHWNAAASGSARNDLAPVCKQKPWQAYVQLAVGTAGCTSSGHADIASETECQRAIESLGSTALPKWTGSYSSIPRFCSMSPSSQGDQSRMHWNAAASGSARNDLAPVCRNSMDGTSASLSLRANTNATMGQKSGAMNTALEDSADLKNSCNDR